MSSRRDAFKVFRDTQERPHNCNNMVKEHYHDILPEREPETYRGFLVATMTTQ